MGNALNLKALTEVSNLPPNRAAKHSGSMRKVWKSLLSWDPKWQPRGPASMGCKPTFSTGENNPPALRRLVGLHPIVNA